MKRKQIELLAPAGDLEKLKFAVLYGADAVYIGGEFFGLRSAAKNFTRNEMEEGIDFAHRHGCRVYLTMNIVPHEGDIEALPAYLQEIKELQIDAFIVSDPGTMMEIRQVIPRAEIHLSTQANTTNSATALFWQQMGVERIVLARELGIREIEEICAHAPEMEFEVFVHGAMCISHSGRCLLSNYLTGRDSNRGDCAQPCRWNYTLTERTRPDEHFPIEQDEHGTYIMNSKDLCLIEKIPELIESGVCSLKIEGRMKTPFYVASVVRVYREAIDRYYASVGTSEDDSAERPEDAAPAANRLPYVYRQEWMDELRKTSHRGFTTAFFDGEAGPEAQNYASAAYTRDYDFAGVVLHYDPVQKMALVEQRNHFALGARIEVIGPSYFSATFPLDRMYDENMQPIEAARHAKMKVYIPTDLPLRPYYILRTEKKG